MVHISALSDKAFTWVALLSIEMYLQGIKSTRPQGQYVIDLLLFIRGLIAAQFVPELIESRLLWGVHANTTVPRGIVARALGPTVCHNVLVKCLALFP